MRLSPQEKARIVRLWSAEPMYGDASGVAAPRGLFVEEPLCCTYDYEELSGLFDTIVERIPDGGRCLDLAAGTEAATDMLRIAAERRGIQVDVTTIDLGEPLVAKSNDSVLGVEFVGRTPPSFPDKSFHAVISIFGFERLKPQLAIPWLRKILVPGGAANCLALSREATMVRDCAEYVRTFDVVVRPWWSDTWGQFDHDARPDLSRRTQLAVEQLEIETGRADVREAHHQAMRRFTERAATTPREMSELWRQAVDYTQLLRVRLACAAEFYHIRQFVRDLELAGLEDVCVVPFQLNEWPFAWHWDATRPDSAA